MSSTSYQISKTRIVCHPCTYISLLFCVFNLQMIDLFFRLRLQGGEAYKMSLGLQVNYSRNNNKFLGSWKNNLMAGECKVSVSMYQNLLSKRFYSSKNAC